MSWIRALILFSALIGVAAAQTTPVELEPGTPVEKSIGGTQTHSYTVKTDEQNLVQLTVEQHGVDVVVSVFSPAGKKLGEYDTPNGTEGNENVSFVVTDSGAYRIDVTPLQSDAPTGRYEIKIGEIRHATDEELKASKNLETLKARGLALLDDLDATIVDLRTPQSRIRVQMLAANMLWDVDEKRANKYATDAIVTFKEMRAAVEGNTKEYIRSYSEVSQIRYEMAYTLMNRQPELALSFVRSNPPLPDPYGNPRDISNQQAGLEVEINNRIAMTDPKRAAEVARETLKSGYSQNLVSTVVNIREKNPELASALAGDIVNKLLNDKLLKNSEAVSLALTLLRVDGPPKRNQPDSQVRRVLTEQQQRDLLQKLMNEVTAYKPPSGMFSPERDQALNIVRWLQSMGGDLDGYLNGAAATLEKKDKELSGGNDPRANGMFKYQNEVATLSPDEAATAIPRAPKEFQDTLYIQLALRVAEAGDMAKARQILNEHVGNVYQRQQALNQLEQQETYRAMRKGKVDEALRAAANLSTPEERASAIIQVVNQIGPGMKRATALNYLEQARALLSPSVQAQGQMQMNALLEIVKAFSRYDAKRAFEILDPLVDQFNDISDAARVMQGFGWEFYQDEELNMSNGNAVANAAIQVSQTMGVIAVRDFDRAKLTADRIKLPEVRLRAYLEIAQQALQASR